MSMKTTQKEMARRGDWLAMPMRQLAALGMMDNASAGRKVKEFVRNAVEGRGGNLANRASGERGGK